MAGIVFVRHDTFYNSVSFVLLYHFNFLQFITHGLPPLLPYRIVPSFAIFISSVLSKESENMGLYDVFEIVF